MSTDPPPTAVKQKYRDSMLPARHLSCPSVNIPYFPPSLQAKFAVTLNATPRPALPQRKTCSVLPTATLDKSEHLDHKIMSWRDHDSAATTLSPAFRPYDRRGPKIFRSTSVADLQTEPTYLEHLASSQASHFSPSSRHLRVLAANEASIQEEENSSQIRQQTEPPAADLGVHQPAASQTIPESTFEEKKMRRRTRYKSYHDLHILSMYQDNASITSLNSTHSTSFKSFVDDEETVERSGHSDTSSQESLPMPETPSDLELTCEPSLIGCAITKPASPIPPKARQVSIVEHHEEKEYFVDDDLSETIPMQATVLTVPGRPRLIQIHRPQPLNLARVQLAPHHQLLEPITPTHYQHEISSFSPYDTPRSGTPFSDISRTASEATPTQNCEPRLIIEDDGEISPRQWQTPPDRIISSRNSERSNYSQQSSRPLFTNPFGSPLSQYSKTSIGESTLIEDSPTSLTRSTTENTIDGSDKSVFARMHQQETYDSSLNLAVAATIKAFDVMAFNGLHLNSAELLPFRNERFDQATDFTLIASLRKIFPYGQQTVLSTLAAWLMVDQHFTRLLSSAPPRLSSPHNDDDSDDDDSDVYTPRRTTVVSASRNNSFAQTAQRNLLRKGSAFDLCISPGGPVNIPTKARSILGIHTDPVGCEARPFPRKSVSSRSRAPSTTTEDHTRSVQRSVQTLGRKLVRDLMCTPPLPEIPVHRRGSRPKSSKGRSSAQTSGCTTPTGEVMDDAVNGMWEACRCIVSML